MFKDKWLALFIAIILMAPLFCFAVAMFKSDLAGMVKYDAKAKEMVK